MVIVGLDVGNARIGVAMCDELEIIASPHSVVPRVPAARALDAIRQVVETTGAGMLVVGLPVSFDGRLHGQAQSVLAFARRLRAVVSAPMVFVDESLSTVTAEDRLRVAGVRADRMRERIDAVAAAVILDDYITNRRTVPDALIEASRRGTDSATLADNDM